MLPGLRSCDLGGDGEQLLGRRPQCSLPSTGSQEPGIAGGAPSRPSSPWASCWGIEEQGQGVMTPLLPRKALLPWGVGFPLPRT